MGRKVHPTGFRLGFIQDWQAKWYSGNHYVEYLQEDLKLRQAIKSKYSSAGVSLVETDRQGDKVIVTINTARPGVVIGRGGQRVDEMRQYLEGLIGNKVQINIQEIRQPELDANLVAMAVAEQIGRRVAYRRAIKQAIFRTIQAGARGIRISCSGRLGGVEIARREVMHQGQVPLHKMRADIDYGFTEARTPLGRIGVKVWIYKGDIFPEAKAEEIEKEVPVALAADVDVEVEPAVSTALGEVLAGVVEDRGVEEPSSVELEEESIVPSAESKEEVVAEAAVEVAAPAEAEEKPAKPAKRKKKAEVVAEAAVEAAAPAEAEEKPVKPARRKKKAEVVAEAAVEAVAPAEAEEKPVKPAKRKKKAEVVAEAAVEAAAPAEAEEKPAKPAKRKKKAEVVAEAAVEVEGQDATT